MSVASVFVVLVVILYFVRTGRVQRLYNVLTSNEPAYSGTRRGGGSTFR